MPRTIDVAITQIGVKEATGKNDGVPAERYCRGNKEPWCARFVVFCNLQSTDRHVVTSEKEWWELGAVQAFEDLMRKRGWWFREIHKAQPNDLIFFGDRGASDASLTGRHMGIVEIATPLALHTVEGNWGNAVQRVTHSFSSGTAMARITGFARVPPP